MNKEITSPHFNNQRSLQSHLLTDASKALSYIPSDLPRDEWVKIATAFKAAGGDFDTFDAWSSTAGNYKLCDTRSVWKSISANGGISAATLIYIAKQYGYKSTSKPTQFEATVMRQLQSDNATKEHGYILAQQQAVEILNQCDYASLESPYLIKKRIRPALLPWIDKYNNLVIPVMDLLGTTHSLQFISPIGDKKFMKGGAIKGHFYQLWTGSTGKIVICEGYATGVTLYRHYTPDCSVFVAFNAGNLLPVAKVLREAYPDSEIIIAGDCDASGVGQKKAEATARAVNGSYSIPAFQKDEAGSDFNDRWCLDNLEVRA